MEQNEKFPLPLLQNGDPGALAQLIEEHGDRLLRAAFVFCRDKGDAQDLVQETFCRAIPALKGFRGECLLYTWLYGILRNLYFSQVRKRGRLFFFSNPPQTESAAPDPERSAESDERRDLLADVLAVMTDKHREILLLRFAEGMKLGEIADMLAVSPGTVKSRLHQALKRVRKKMPADWVSVRCGEEAHEM
jgi:RNA polymerase sigma-70 factor (ECF subfamily)